MARKQDDTYVHWRDSARPTRFFFVDGSALVLIIVMLVYPNWTKTYIVLSGCFILGVLAYFKLPLPVAGRMLFTALVGKNKVRD